MSDEYDVTNEALQKVLAHLAEYIDSQLTEEFGFSLMIFSWGEPRSMFYISNAERSTMIQAMQEFVRVQKARGI